MSTGKKRPSVASRYLAAIHCPAAEPVVAVQQHGVTPPEAPLSPQTVPWKAQQQQTPQTATANTTSESESFGSTFSKQSSVIQTRSTGNSPSSSRRSRASRTPPRDSAVVVDISCQSVPQLRTNLFPATSSGLGKHEVEHDTDGSSLTSQGTPSLQDEDDTSALLMRETKERINARLKRPYRLQKSGGRGSGDWRSRMDGTANYRRRQQQQQSPQLTPTATRQEAPTEVMMNLSSIQVQTTASLSRQRRPTETMTDVTGTSTEIITNRATDFHRRILGQQHVDERDTAETAKQQRPLHLQLQQQTARFQSHQPTVKTRRQSSRKWPAVKNSTAYQRKMPIEINSLLSDTSAELTEDSGRKQTTVYPGHLHTGRLGRHVGQQQQQQEVNVVIMAASADTPVQQRLHRRETDSKTSFESFQERSLSSSVGVETGVHVVSKSTPALKRVFEETQPNDGIPDHQTRKAERQPSSPQRLQQEVSAVAAGEKVASPEEPAPRTHECPPRPPLSAEKTSLSSNPFMVRYSAKGTSPNAEQRALDDVGTAPSDTSSGGWTPVPLSSSGMISEDFVLDPDRSPMGKDVQPLQALFSADRIASSSRSPFEKLYQPDSSVEESHDSVGPPNIHRVTAKPLSKTAKMSVAQDAPGLVASDNAVVERDNAGWTPSHRPISEGHRAVRAPSSMPNNVAMESDPSAEARKPATKSLPHSRVWRRELLRRKQRRLLHKNGAESHRDAYREQNALDDTTSMSKIAGDSNAMNDSGPPVNELWDQRRTQRTAQSSSVSRKLFPTSESESREDFRESAVVESSGRNESSGAHAILERGGGVGMEEESRDMLRSVSPVQLPSVRDRVTSFSPTRKALPYVPPWKAKLKDDASNKNKSESPNVHDKKSPEYIPPWKLELIKKKAMAQEQVPVRSSFLETTGQYTPPWKLELMKKRETHAANDIPGHRGEQEAAAISGHDERSIRNDEDHVRALQTQRSSDPSNFAPSPSKSSGSVRDLASRFSPSNESSTLPPWVVKATRKSKSSQTLDSTDRGTPEERVVKTPAADTHVVKSAPPRLSVRDRALALSGETFESTRLSGASLRSKRSFSDTMDESPRRTGQCNSLSHIDGEVDGNDSPRKTMKTSPLAQTARRSHAASLLGALSAQVDPSDTSNPSVEESNAGKKKAPRNSLVLAAHLAATADDISPQDRYRRRFRNNDETTATEASQEISDVQSLKSFFEGSLATAPSDEEDDSDDRTVESLRSKFETVHEREEEPSAVSKMRAMFEKPKQSVSSRKGFAGNDAVSVAFTKFERDARWTPSKSTGTRRTLVSAETESLRSSHNRVEAAVTSAPSKLQSTRSVVRSPPKPEDTERRRQHDVKPEDRKSSLPHPISVTERIRALKLEQSTQKVPTKPVATDEIGDAIEQKFNTPSAASRHLFEQEVEPVEATIASHLQMKRENVVNGQVLNCSPKDQAPPRDSPHVGAQSKGPAFPEGFGAEKTPSATTAAAYPSVRDRVNALSEKRPGESKRTDGMRSNLAVERAKSLAYGRKSWSQNQSHFRQKSTDERNINTRANDLSHTDDEQAHQVVSIPSDEKIESGEPVKKANPKSEGSEVSCDGTASANSSEYDDGVTLDLSIADVSQLTNPTCLESKDDGAAGEESSSEVDNSSEHTSDVVKGTNTEAKGPSEASSSQASEAAAPLIARMRFSDDASTSVNSAKGAPGGRSKSGHQPSSRWEPLTPVVDEAEVARQSPDGTHESAWSRDEIDATFPVESNLGGTSEKVEGKLWQPFQAENWEASPSFGTNWTPPANVDPFEMTVSEATSFGRLSENTPVRRNTSRRASPPYGNKTVPPPRDVAPSRESTRRSPPIQTRLFSRTRPTPSESTPENIVGAPPKPNASETDQRQAANAAPRTSPITPATSRASPTKDTETVVTRESATSSHRTTASGISKHAVLMSKLRSLKEARIRRSAAAGFHRSNVVYPSERRPPPTTTTPRGSSPASSTSALAPFLRPGFIPSKPPHADAAVRGAAATQQHKQQQQHFFAAPESSSIPSVDDEQSASTRSSTQFGGNKFVESLELD